MRLILLKVFLPILMLVLLAFDNCFAQVSVGQPAPFFSASDSNGKTVSLSDFKGKFVVLEWINHGCPFVRKHYEGGNMQKLQGLYTAKGVIWLSISSSAHGKEGFMTAEQANLVSKEKKSLASHFLLDSDGQIGRLYGARTTPHMFIIGPEGKLIYAGAIDDNDSSRLSSVEGANNYVAKSLDEAISGKEVSEPSTEPYGCSVKYGN